MRLGAIIPAVAAASVALHPFAPTRAVPAFAGQTGLACSACHVGAFGPQLTPYGRAFKIQGYAVGGGSGLASEIPLSAFLLGSYTNTNKNQSAPASEHYGSNGNFAMDQISVFLAGRIGDHVGALIQGTFDGIASQAYLDNSDIRVVTSTKAFGYDADIGLSFNNSPGLSDPYNSTYPFGYDFVSSALAPTPNAGTILGGSLAGNALGLNAYAWIDQHIYVDLGLYDTMAPGLLRVTGNAYGPGSETGVAPYGRAAYEWNWGDNNAHVGGALFYSRYNPIDLAEDGRSADGSYGHDAYTDLFADAGYQLLKEENAFTIDSRYDYEIQNLKGSSNPLNPAFASSQKNGNLQEVRHTLTYYYIQTYGLTLSWDKIWGKKNDALYNNGQPDIGSIKGSPLSNAFIVEADWVPFGKDSSWERPFANLKVGVQYTIYTQFNGSSHNYDGFGRAASDNDTLYLFLWTIF
jgi:hypothetical protein